MAEKDMEKHAPTPWTVDPYDATIIMDAKEGFLIAHIAPAFTTEAVNAANAAHIVKCVNHFDALVKALRRHALQRRSVMVEGGKFAPNGFCCDECKSEWGGFDDLHKEEVHNQGCLCAIKAGGE